MINKEKIYWLILLSTLLLFTKTSHSQGNGFISQVKEKIKLLADKQYDSVIAFTYSTSYIVPLPALENLDKQTHSSDAFLLCFKNDSCFAICMAQYDSGIATSNSILLPENPEIKLLRSSRKKIEAENFRPFVYKEYVNGTTSYDTLYALHPTYGNLTYRGRQHYVNKDFCPVNTEETARDLKNEHFEYNRSLHLYAVYQVLNNFSIALKDQFLHQK